MIRVSIHSQTIGIMQMESFLLDAGDLEEKHISNRITKRKITHFMTGFLDDIASVAEITLDHVMTKVTIRFDLRSNQSWLIFDGADFFTSFGVRDGPCGEKI